ncbi:MAG: dTMP kinase [Archaeoglobaceae archaeon]|nr:dTMP kinase [Archaeoglobaceae archaeon]MCX8151653.1 dTMP kinase [Archaeoglobaceae archaeon]MDW8013069.1 dTMP kinase [Archaeoglobaceae archaeon]
MLIAVEGIDGAGKSTIVKFLAEELKKLSYDVVTFKEPSDSEYGKILRSMKERLDAEKELELFLKDRSIDVQKNIIPALSSGKIVIMDRYYYSNIAYQAARGLNAEIIKRENEKIAPKPDLVILLDLDVETALSRKESRSVFEDKEYLKKVREEFLKLKDDNIKIVDASRPVEEVKKEVLKIVTSILPKEL